MNDDWQKYGECSKKVHNEEIDMESLDGLFFPDGTTEITEEKIAEAKKVCDICSVIDKCKDWAIAKKIDPGIWGGHSEEERRVIRRDIRKKKTGNISKNDVSSDEE